MGRIGEGSRCFRDAELLKTVMDRLAPIAASVEGPVLEQGGGFGYCRGCARWVWFSQGLPAADDWANLTEGMLCTCGLNGRMRGILAALDDLLLGLAEHPENAAVFERLTPMYPVLEQRLPGLCGSEYMGEEYAPGAIVTSLGVPVRHESFSGTSYGTDSQDLVMHFDVLEHVPDPSMALGECHRILRPGGWLLFSTPFYEDLDESIVRATIHDGVLRHVLEPAYHGNPVDGGGALVFTQFGWDLLAMIERAGFPEGEVWLMLNPMEGVLTNACPYPDGHAWPLVFAARKA